MLLPTQQFFGLAATNAMQSMLDSIEEQRKKQDEQQTGKQRDLVTEAKISASEESKRAKDKIASALFGANNADPNEVKIKLIDRLANKLGIDTDEARSSFSLGKALGDLLKNISPADAGKLEDDLGLTEMGVSLTTLLGSIQNPYGDDNQRLMDGINRKINGGKLGTEVERVVQRLEGVADPKTLAELKLGPQGYDPTRIEDAQVQAERQVDISAAEAGEKLKDVQKVRDAVEKNNDTHASRPGTESGVTAEVDAAEADAAKAVVLITVLAAAAEQIDDTADAAQPADAGDPGTVTTDGDSSSAQAASTAEASTRAATQMDGAGNLADRLAANESTDVQPIRIDDIGIYELLERKIAA